MATGLDLPPFNFASFNACKLPLIQINELSAIEGEILAGLLRDLSLGRYTSVGVEFDGHVSVSLKDQLSSVLSKDGA